LQNRKHECISSRLFREAAGGGSCQPKLRCKNMWAGNSARIVAVIYFEG